MVWVVVIGGAKEIDWFAPTGEKIEPGKQDVSVIRNDETSSTLTIYNAKVENAGTYKCVASSGDQDAEATVNLKIYRKIPVYDSSVLTEYIENANSKVDITNLIVPFYVDVWQALMKFGTQAGEGLNQLWGPSQSL